MSPPESPKGSDGVPASPGESGPRERQRGKARSPTLLAYAVQVGLTPLIPVPLLDDAVQAHLERRLVTHLAHLHGMTLTKEAVREIANGPRGGLLRKVAMGAVTLPFKFLFRKVLFVLEIKRASDAASEAYHRGYLLDLALSAGALAPVGPRSPAELREAIDAALADGAVSPIGTAIRRVFESSRDLLARAGSALTERVMARVRPGTAPEVTAEQAVESFAARDATSSEPRAVGGLVERLGRAIDEIPAEHFDALERHFETALGVPLPR